MPERPRPKLDRVREQLRRDDEDPGYDPDAGPLPARVTEESDRTQDPAGDTGDDD